MSLDNVQDVYPLSPMQEGMLFHSLQAPESGVFVEQLHTCLQGDFRLECFQQAWSTVIARHDALRTSILWDGLDEPLQVVNHVADLPWTVLDWSERSRKRQKQAFEELLSADRSSGFELDAAPAMRMHLIRTASEEWTWLWSFHHILLDGWSGAILRDELLDTYRQLKEGKAPELTSVPSFREYIAWLRVQDESEAADFWRSYFSDFHGPSSLVSDAAAPSKSANAYFQHRSSLSEVQSSQLFNAAKKTRVTSNTMIQAAWALNIAQHSDRQDVCFGVTLSGRSAQIPKIEQAVGMFIATLPLRTRIDLGTSLECWLQGIQASQSSVRDYEYCSLASIQKWAGQIHEPLFDSLVVFENYPTSSSISLDGIGLKVAEFEHIEQSNYPIALLVVPGPTMRFILIRDSARVSERFANELLENFQQLLLTLLDHALGDSNASATPTLGEALSASGQVPSPLAVEASDVSTAPQVLSWFSEQVGLRPNESAVVYQGEHLSYQMLEVWSNRIANHLIASGVQTGQFVGLCLQPSLEMLAAILGIMKSGAAYVPLDPAYPQEVVCKIARDAKLQEVVVDKSVSAELFAGSILVPDSETDSALRLFSVESLVAESFDSSERPNVDIGATDYAYMIYTSGSTGTPKGVPVTHKNLDYSTAARKNFYRSAPEKFLLMSSISFDSSVAGIFWTLASGGTLVLTSQEQRTDMNALARLIEDTQTTHSLMLPSLYELVLDAANEKSLLSLQCMIVAGEECDGGLGEKHFCKAPRSRLFNEYGPTEGTVWCSVHEVTHQSSGEVPIGKSLSGTELFIADALGRSVSDGMKGEICIAGPGVVKGYWQRPRLTTRKFFLRRDSSGRKQWVYRTGDIGTRSPTGELRFFGRNDHQVKIRGHRIELRAVETQLLEIDGVKQAQVATSGQGLVAHVVGSSDLEDALRARVAQALPEYMAPSQYRFWKEFPRLPNGKVDLRKLSESQKIRVRGSDQGPKTETERLLHDIWCEALELESVGVHDDFFAIGGDSLSSIRVLSMARNAGLVLGSPAQLVETSTIASLAEKLGEPYSEVLVRFNAAQTQEVLVLLAAGGVDATFYRHLAAHFPDVTVVGLQSRGLNGSQPHRRIEDIASDCIAALKNSVGFHKEFHLVGRCVACPVSLEVATQLEEMDAPARSLTILDSSLRWAKQTVDYHYYYRRFQNPLLALAALCKFRLRKRYRWYRRKTRRLYERAFESDWREQSYRRHVQAVSMQAQDEYQPRGTQTPITLIRSSEYAQNPRKDFHVQQWETVALGGISYATVPGTHPMMLKEPMVSEVAGTIRGHLNARDTSYQPAVTNSGATG